MTVFQRNLIYSDGRWLYKNQKVAHESDLNPLSYYESLGPEIKVEKKTEPNLMQFECTI